MKFFKENIERRIPPKKTQVDQLYKTYAGIGLPDDWKKFKVFIQNIYTQKSRY